jgi:hypothetical protein
VGDWGRGGVFIFHFAVSVLHFSLACSAQSPLAPG